MLTQMKMADPVLVRHAFPADNDVYCPPGLKIIKHLSEELIETLQFIAFTQGLGLGHCLPYVSYTLTLHK